MIISKDKYWKNVRKEEQRKNLFLIYLDEVCLKSDKGHKLKLSEQLANEVVREWSVDGKLSAIKNSFFTKFCFSATDITKKQREAIFSLLVEYANCDPICYIACEPTNLHLKQKNLYSPLISKGAKYLNTSRRAAELIKYASNAFLATKITSINELANLSEKLNINIEDVSIGIGSDKRIGSRFLRAGPAYGGSCFPKDTRALVYTSKVSKTNF